VGALDPAKPPVLVEHKICSPRRRRGGDVSVPSPAFLAVADQHVIERPANDVAHGSAKAATRRHLIE